VTLAALRVLITIIFLGSILILPLRGPVTTVWARVVESEGPIFTMIFGGIAGMAKIIILLLGFVLSYPPLVAVLDRAHLLFQTPAVDRAKSTAVTNVVANTAASAIPPGTEEDLVTNIGDRIFFDPGSSSLSHAAQDTLSHQAAWLVKMPQVLVQVAGNCDQRASETQADALGKRRANAAQTYLISKGVSASRITVVSFGRNRPTALGEDEKAWSQNRNVIVSVR
jgi:peptidoglycan-associated lipoprotein